MSKITIHDPSAHDEPDGCIEVTVRGQAEDDRGLITDMAVTGRYWGGEYIELFAPAEIDPNSPPFDVINVFDYRAGCPWIEFSAAAVRQSVADWLRDRLAEEVDA